VRSRLRTWILPVCRYEQNPNDVSAFEKEMRLKAHYVIGPEHLWASITHMARTQDGELLNTLQAGFKYIENESFQSTFSGLFSEINLGSDKLGKTYADRNVKLCTIITKIAEGLAEFSTDSDTLGDAYEYLIGQFAAGSGKKAGEFYTPQRISDILSAIVTLDSQEPKTGKRKHLASVMDFACGSGSLLLNVRKRMGLQPRADEHAAARGERFRVRDLPRRHADQRLGHAPRDESGEEAQLRRRCR
jgi:type I restriction enzyme M protein